MQVCGHAAMPELIETFRPQLVVVVVVVVVSVCDCSPLA
jgi:hypothetical protein